MPEGRFKSRTFRRLKVRTPGNRNVLRYEARKPESQKCSSCGNKLNGIPRERPGKMMTLAKSKKTVERPFGGNLCSPCTRREMIRRARQNLF